MPQAANGIAAQAPSMSFEKSGETQMQVMLPNPYPQALQGPYAKFYRQGENQISVNMPVESSSFEHEVRNNKGMSLEQYYLNVPTNINDNSEINKLKVQE